MNRLQKQISKGEQVLIDMGLYVPLPINLQILLDQSERDVLNSLRHCYNMGETFVSASVIALMTGLGEKTVRKARDRLVDMGFLTKGKTCGLGTHYPIEYKKLYTSLLTLNNEPDPEKRVALAKEMRDKHLNNNKLC